MWRELSGKATPPSCTCFRTRLLGCVSCVAEAEKLDALWQIPTHGHCHKAWIESIISSARRAQTSLQDRQWRICPSRSLRKTELTCQTNSTVILSEIIIYCVASSWCAHDNSRTAQHAMTVAKARQQQYLSFARANLSMQYAVAQDYLRREIDWFVRLRWTTMKMQAMITADQLLMPLTLVHGL